VLAICALSASLFAAGAWAANGAGGSADVEAKYQQDIARCNAGQTSQDIATCKQEAGAARDDALRHRLNTPPTQSNATQRCQALPAGKREDCMTQMSPGSNTTVQGSVAGGGILRTTEITIP